MYSMSKFESNPRIIHRQLDYEVALSKRCRCPCTQRWWSTGRWVPAMCDALHVSAWQQAMLSSRFHLRWTRLANIIYIYYLSAMAPSLLPHHLPQLGNAKCINAQSERDCQSIVTRSRGETIAKCTWGHGPGGDAQMEAEKQCTSKKRQKLFIFS